MTKTALADRLVPLLALGAFIAIAVPVILRLPYPSHFDELEHVAYAAWLQETREWRPMFEAMLDLPGDSLTHWDTRPNYLGHPSPFYWYEALFLDRTLPLWPAILRVRLASAALATIGVGLALWAGARMFRRDWLAVLVFALLVALCPKLHATVGQVTNDSLAVLAGGLAYWGACTEARRRWPGLLACAAGLMLALWAKPNAGLAVGAALGFYALLRLRARPSLVPALAVGGALGLGPSVPILLKYGGLVPVTVEQFGNVRSVPGIVEYLPAFLFTVAYTFCFDQTGTWPVPGQGAVAVVALVWLLLAAVLLGGVLAIWDGGAAPERLVAIAGALALLAVVPIHFWFSATRLGGSLPAASFRYYLPIWPFLAHAAAYCVLAGSIGVRWGVALVAVLALGVGWLSP